MTKLLSLIFILFSTPTFAADFGLYIQNSMMTGISETGQIELGTIDPFNPSTFCNNFISPNSCTIASRETLNISLDFSYVADIYNTTSTLDLIFGHSNGYNGGGNFQNIQVPQNIYGITNQSSGNFNLDFQIPIFGPNSSENYSLLLTIDVILNP